ncbi:hypothetical protein FS842_003768 [Serendipita sp. 407]|nr:hypothetical protein FS842_003768 [Serendipita sp. 407]
MKGPVCGKTRFTTIVHPVAIWYGSTGRADLENRVCRGLEQECPIWGVAVEALWEKNSNETGSGILDAPTPNVWDDAEDPELDQLVE